LQGADTSPPPAINEQLRTKVSPDIRFAIVTNVFLKLIILFMIKLDLTHLMFWI